MNEHEISFTGSEAPAMRNMSIAIITILAILLLAFLYYAPDIKKYQDNARRDVQAYSTKTQNLLEGVDRP